MKKHNNNNNKNNKIILIAIAAIVVLLIVFGRQTKENAKPAEELKESTGSGFLEVVTSPSNAEIFVDGVSSGKSPDTIYNIPVGSHNIVIKKSGYEDFSSQVSIGAGKKAHIEASLAAVPSAEKKAEAAGSAGKAPETANAVEKAAEKIAAEEKIAGIKANGVIDIGNRFLIYYDFNEGNFTNRRYADSDAFSNRYDKHFVFIRFAPASVKTISKSIDTVKKPDCIGKKGEYEFLYSEQTMCITTKEGQIAAIGGKWENTENTEIVWKLFN